MDSRVIHSKVNHDNDEHHPHNIDSQQQVVSPGAEEHNSAHDSKSTVFVNKVKAKAKKISNTIKNIGHHEDAPTTPIYDTEAVKSAPPAPEKVKNLVVSEVDFGDTKDNIPNHQTKVTDPSGKGSDEINDSTKVEESLERLNVQDETKPTIEPKTQPAFAETEYPIAGRNDQFDPQTKIQYDRATASETFSPQNDEPSKLAHDEKDDRNEDDKVKETHDDYEKVMLELKEEVPETNTSGDVGTETKNEDKDHAKGVPVKDYLAEKLRPGEEDKALSEVISETLHKKEEEPVKKEDGELASGNEKSEKVSEEPNVESPEKGYVDKFKGAVGSWFYTSEEKQSPQVAGDEDLLKNKDSAVERERVSQVKEE